MNQENSKSKNTKHNSLMKGKKRCQSGTRTLAVCFTKNLSCNFDYSATAVRRLQITQFMHHVNVDSIMDYWCVGFEYGEKKKHPHLQGYFHLQKQLGFSRIKKMLGDDVHFEFAKGTPEENREYCRKGLDPKKNPTGFADAVFMERGDLPQQGKRNDLHAMREMFKSGRPLCEVVLECKSYQAMKGAELLSKYIVPNITKKKKVEVLWFYGPTGTGKTHAAYALVEERGMGDSLWVSADSLKWFDGYGGQRAVIVDDIRRDDINFNYLLRLLDGRPIRCPVKGSFVTWNPDLIIFTCPMDAASFCPCTENNEQLTRRVVQRQFKDRYVEQVEEVQVEGAAAIPAGSELKPFNGVLAEVQATQDYNEKKKEVIEIE